MTLGRRCHDERMRRGHELEPSMVLRHGDRREGHGAGGWEQRGDLRVEFTGHPSHDTAPGTPLSSPKVMPLAKSLKPRQTNVVTASHAHQERAADCLRPHSCVTRALGMQAGDLSCSGVLMSRHLVSPRESGQFATSLMEVLAMCVQQRPPMARTKDTLRIICRITGNDPALRQMTEEETINAHVARTVYEARTKAGPTQQEPAAGHCAA
jgi:hypothetical protein